MPRGPDGKVTPGSYGPESGGAYQSAVDGARTGADAALEPDMPPAGGGDDDQQVLDIVNEPQLSKEEKLQLIEQILDKKDGLAPMGPSPAGPPMGGGGPPMGPPPGGPPPGLPSGPMGGM